MKEGLHITALSPFFSHGFFRETLICSQFVQLFMTALTRLLSILESTSCGPNLLTLVDFTWDASAQTHSNTAGIHAEQQQLLPLISSSSSRPGAANQRRPPLQRREGRTARLRFERHLVTHNPPVAPSRNSQLRAARRFPRHNQRLPSLHETSHSSVATPYPI